MLRQSAMLALMLAIAGAGTGLATAQPPASQPKPAPAKAPANTDERPKPAGQEVDLRPKFTLGKLTRYEMTMTSGNKIKSDQEDLNQDQAMMQSIGLSMKVKSVDDDGATVELVYDRIKASLETGDTKATFDSTAPKTTKPTNNSPTSTPAKPTKTTPTSPKTKPGTKTPSNSPTPTSKPAGGAGDADMSELLSQIMGPMVGTTLTMKVDKDGNIKSVSGGDALTGAGAAAGLLGGAGGAGGLGGLGGGMGLPVPQAGGSASNPMSWIVNSPGQKSIVHVGESWTNTDSLGGTPVGGFKMVTKHTCRSDGPTANLVFSGRADQASEGQGESPTGFTLKETTYNGDYSWDTVRGELSNLNSTLKAAIDGKIAGFAISLSSNTKVTVKRLN